MSGRADRTPRLRVVAIADADSFVKWSAATLDGLARVSAHIVLVRTPLVVSAAQQEAALAGTRFTGRDVTRVGYDELATWLAADRPDVVLVAGRGQLVRLIQRQIDRVHPRPIVVSGLPGISIPAQRGAAQYRRYADLVVIHSRREQRAFFDLAQRLDLPLELGLATLPYARVAGAGPAVGVGSAAGSGVVVDSAAGSGVAAGSAGGSVRREGMPGGTDLVFAAQAMVPRERRDREIVADILRRAALADPTRRVVVKLRSRPGEQETHFERTGYPELLDYRPDNLVFSYAPMAEALQTAEGLVTVSSTAAIEAMAQGVPVIALDTFGVGKQHLNTVFSDSGLLGSAEDVVARRFRHPHPLWLRENYFHDVREATWWSRVEELVARRRRGELPARTVPQPPGGALQIAWQRKTVLGAEDHTLSGAVALAIGTPLDEALRALRRLRGRRGADTWFDAASDITVTATRHRDPLRRRASAARG